MNNQNLVNSKQEVTKTRLVCLGAEKYFDYLPSNSDQKRNYVLEFEEYNSTKRLNEYDGAMVFQGLFENVEFIKRSFEPTYTRVNFDRNQLDKRKKEIELLTSKKGFVCFIVHKPFIDRDGTNNFEHTDLCKYCLNYPKLYRKNFSTRVVNLNIVKDEFRDFLSIYGASHSYYENYNETIDVKVIATVNRQIVSMIIERNQFFIPVLLPEDVPDRIDEFFNLLCESVINTVNKIRTELPDWADEFRFDKEKILLDRRSNLLEELNSTESSIIEFRQFKRVLVESGDDLVESVADVLSKGFGFSVARMEEFKEDIKIVDGNDEPIALIEAKGTNSGIKNENINQTYNHRERNDLPESFPAILVINTAMNKARNLTEKDHQVGVEQIKHASKMGVLIVRTIDLLGLLKLVFSNKLSRDEALNTLVNNRGWLKVFNDNFEILTGN